MSGPLIFVSRSRVKPGQREVYQEHLAAATDLVDSEEPRVIGFNSYASADGTEVSTVHVHPDAESLDNHLALYAAKLRDRAEQSVDSFEIDVYGQPSDGALEFLNGVPQSIPGLTVRILPVHEMGFLRPQPL